ncbi:hypothetical protein [Nocardia macrotermitis]|uniref:Uncharacterized protein n=1 Tax=Nocardia macrotermitis TaxID=2585198 RepID=A0A7K0DBH2_9NOCA|nr:hypothetical protein [Nocardia macrotermitis]MQY23028.1 hypothetical protein [Nocardia macrotermitis]
MTTHPSIESTLGSTAAQHPARVRCARAVVMVLVVIAAGVLVLGHAASVAAQPPVPPTSPASPAAAVSTPPEPFIPARPSTSPPPTPRPSWDPNPVQPNPMTTASPTPGPDAPNPAMPEPAYPGGADPNFPTPYPTPSPAPAPADPDSSGGPWTSPQDGGSNSCGITNISGCVEHAIDTFLQHLVSSALNPLLELLGQTLLTTPDPDTLPQLGVLWNNSWQLVLAIYGIVVMVAGVLAMVHHTLQTRWSVRELAPRLLIGFLAGAMSMLIATGAIRLANALARAVAGSGVDPSSTATAIRQLIEANNTQADTFLLCLELALQVMLVILFVAYAVRVAVTIILIVGAPLAVMCHALPGIDAIARWWWRSFAACLAIQVAQSLILVTVLRVFLTPNGWAVIGPNSSGAVDIMVGIALIGVLAKAPFWLLSVLKIGQGRTLVGSIVRSYITYKTLGLLKSGRAATPRAPSKVPAPRKVPAPKDPYARVRATPDGQLMLPLKGLKRVPPKPAPPQRIPHARTIPVAQPQGEQLMLPLPQFHGGVALGPTPRLGRDGQYQLPITVHRVRTPAPTREPPVPKSLPGTRGRRPKQLAFDFTFTEADPYRGIRPRRNGQYPLPIATPKKVPRDTSAPAAATPPPPPSGSVAEKGRQLHLPLPDLPVKRRTSPGGAR